MSETELAALERDVEAARQKVVADLARLRSTTNLNDFKTDLAAEARAYGDEYLQKAKQGATSFAQQALADLKEKAIANPAAAAAIGAGVAWRLFRSPPIASLLIGGGLISLMRTDADPGPPGPYDRERPSGYVPGGVAGFGYEPDEGPAANRARRAAETAQSLQYRAEDLATSVKEGAADLASTVKDQVSGLAASARDQAAGLATSAREQAARLAASATGQAAGLTASVTGGAADLASSAREKASEWSNDARDTTRATAARLARTAEATQSRFSDAAEDMADRTSRAALELSRSARAMSRNAADMLPANVSRDTYLFGAAALAIGAAIGIALHRRAGNGAE